MQQAYGRDLDLNLLRVFVVVAETGSVTKAAASLYLTQPAVSAALKRLADTVGAPLFVRQGRGLVLSTRGTRLLGVARPALQSLVDAALHVPDFDPATSDRVIRLGLSDSTESWLLPPLLRVLARSAPGMRLIVTGVQFRTVEEALVSRRIDAAITVADALPPSIRRRALFQGDFVCLFDPRHALRSGKQRKRRITERDYFAEQHVIVSYNADLRGIVEDLLGKSRDVRCSLDSFAHLGDVVAGTRLVATVPRVIATEIVRVHPKLLIAELPFRTAGTPVELLWPVALDDDPAARWIRERVVEISSDSGRQATAR